MSQFLRRLPCLETQYDGPTPRSTSRSALFDGPAFIVKGMLKPRF